MTHPDATLPTTPMLRTRRPSCRTWGLPLLLAALLLAAPEPEAEAMEKRCTRDCVSQRRGCKQAFNAQRKATRAACETARCRRKARRIHRRSVRRCGRAARTCKDCCADTTSACTVQVAGDRLCGGAPVGFEDCDGTDARACPGACRADCTCPLQPGPAARRILSLNGTWEIAEGTLGTTPPSRFDHLVRVPGLVTGAEPPFPEVGVPSARREAFWYRTAFVAPDLGAVTILNIHKAKYGIRVWLNGRDLGEHLGSYTLASFDVSDVVVAGETNTLLVRVGAHLTSVPPWVPAGEDSEKARWIPGIWDDVTLLSMDSPRIVRTKIEPDIDLPAARVLTTLRHDGEGPAPVELRTEVSEWNDRARAFPQHRTTVIVPPDEEVTVEQVVSMPAARLWSPETPFLYAATTHVIRDGAPTDDLDTRFGMRTVQWRGGPDYSGRFYLNGRPYYLRGSNIALHRFFEDELAGGLPWDEAWVRRLLTEHPRALSWNSFRFVIGRAPNFWYDLADEIGLVIADEFQMWSLAQQSRRWSVGQMAVEYTEWIQENWNHPSIAWWDASNETRSPKSTVTIDRVRHLDPTRQWENGGEAPHSPNDPIETHPYLIVLVLIRGLDMTAFETLSGTPEDLVSLGVPAFLDPTHPYIANEYAALWLNRDGSTTRPTGPTYAFLVGPDASAAERREAYAYLTAGLTEFLRAKRAYAGVQHFVYLSHSRVGGYTSDNFVDVENLVLEPRWAHYAANAFRPLGLYIDAWAETYPAGETVDIAVDYVNDLDLPQSATIQLLTTRMDGTVATRSTSVEVDIAPLGAGREVFSIEMPSAGRYMLFARLEPHDASLPATWSRRKVGFAHPGERGPDPPAD